MPSGFQKGRLQLMVISKHLLGETFQVYFHSKKGILLVRDETLDAI
jgi:hypothetical protein